MVMDWTVRMNRAMVAAVAIEMLRLAKAKPRASRWYSVTCEVVHEMSAVPTDGPGPVLHEQHRAMLILLTHNRRTGTTGERLAYEGTGCCLAEATHAMLGVCEAEAMRVSEALPRGLAPVEVPVGTYPGNGIFGVDRPRGWN